jgi:glycerophosphoryl diester phosphodiesterase
VDKPQTISGRPVAVIAHRGYHQQEPENSLAAFVEALAMGVNGIEVDIRLAGDGSIVCFHDWYLKRLTGVSGRVSRLGIQKLLDHPLRHPSSKRERPIAVLAEVLELVKDRVRIVLDLKKESVRPSELEQRTIAQLREKGLADHIVISSFNPWVLKRCKQLAPEFQTALIVSTRLGVRLYDPSYCNGLHVHCDLLRRHWFRRIYNEFPRLMVWTVDREADLDFPLPDQIQGIITNRPERWGAHRPGRQKLKLHGAGHSS